MEASGVQVTTGANETDKISSFMLGKISNTFVLWMPPILYIVYADNMALFVFICYTFELNFNANNLLQHLGKCLKYLY